MNYDRFIQVPIYAVVTVVERRGLVLSASRPGDPNDLSLPGGRVDLGENPDEAAIRELREETGVVAQRIARVYEREAVRAYVVERWTGVARDVETGTTVRWVSWRELLSETNTFHDYNRRLRARLRRR